MGNVDFDYEISDERLLAYSRIPLLDRLKWLDEVRRFTLLARTAPIVARSASQGTSSIKATEEGRG
jgi:hypothetical protein